MLESYAINAIHANSERIAAMPWGARQPNNARISPSRLGYRTTRAAASLGAWDIIGIGSTDVVLVQVKTRDWPGLVEMEALQSFPCPPQCRKLVHRWRDRQQVPDVKMV